MSELYQKISEKQGCRDKENMGEKDRRSTTAPTAIYGCQGFPLSELLLYIAVSGGQNLLTDTISPAA